MSAVSWRVKWLSSVFFSLAAFAMATPVWSACEIEDVVAMVEDEESSKDIRADCDRKVVDAGSCSLTKVIRLAEEGQDGDEIRDECASDGGDDDGTVTPPPPSRLSCCNPYTGAKVCPMVIAGPVGTVCSCQGIQGAGVICL